MILSKFVFSVIVNTFYRFLKVVIGCLKRLLEITSFEKTSLGILELHPSHVCLYFLVQKIKLAEFFFWSCDNLNGIKQLVSIRSLFQGLLLKFLNWVIGLIYLLLRWLQFMFSVLGYFCFLLCFLVTCLLLFFGIFIFWSLFPTRSLSLSFVRSMFSSCTRGLYWGCTRSLSRSCTWCGILDLFIIIISQYFTWYVNFWTISALSACVTLNIISSMIWRLAITAEPPKVIKSGISLIFGLFIRVKWRKFVPCFNLFDFLLS